MRAKTLDDIARIHESLNTVKRMTDGIIKLGPINVIGLDGILAWVPIPGLNTVYSVGAGCFILFQGIRARASLPTLLGCVLCLLTDSGVSAFQNLIPILPSGLDTFFQGHLYAAHLVTSEIEKTTYSEDSLYGAHRSGAYETDVAQMKATKGKSRIVYLG